MLVSETVSEQKEKLPKAVVLYHEGGECFYWRMQAKEQAFERVWETAVPVHGLW
jgi:hypothetical protein